MPKKKGDGKAPKPKEGIAEHPQVERDKRDAMLKKLLGD